MAIEELWNIDHWRRVRLNDDFHLYKNNAWVTMDNDFWVMSETICQQFSQLKFIGKSLQEWPKKTLLTVNNIFFVLHATLCPEHHSDKNNYRSLILPYLLWRVLSDLTLWRHHSWSAMPGERVVLALWCHIRPLFLHTQIGAKAIFTSEWQPWKSISCHPVFTAWSVRNSNKQLSRGCWVTINKTLWNENSHRRMADPAAA